MNDITNILFDYFKALRPDLVKELRSFKTLPLKQLIDSLGMLELLPFLEATFDIQIEESDAVFEHFQNISSLVSYITKKKDKK